MRNAVAAHWGQRYGLSVDPETQVTVCCGSTEAMMATLLGIVDPGDEVIVFEPFYENYGPDAILSGAVARYVRLHEPDWHIDFDELASAFGNRTRAIILNTPNNPTGKVFTVEELTEIAHLCHRWDVVAITDEIYEHIVYDQARHVPIATIEGMAERTVSIGSLSKTFSVTGWRVGWAVSPPQLAAGIRKVHDFLTVGAPAPLQEAGAAGLGLPDEYYADLAGEYQHRRDLLVDVLARSGFGVFAPQGAYYVMTDISRFGFADDVSFARYLTSEIGVATVPGSSFYRDPALGAQRLRFCFCKTDETLLEAGRRLQRLAQARST